MLLFVGLTWSYRYRDALYGKEQQDEQRKASAGAIDDDAYTPIAQAQ